MARRAPRHLLLAACLAAAGCASSPPEPPPPATGTVHGRVEPADAALSAGDVPQVVVYLEPLEPGWHEPSQPVQVTLPHGERASWPALLTVAAGDSVEFRGGEELHHRIFSYSDANTFEFELGGPDDAELVELRHAGLVRFYCSLHPWENGVILVVPSHHFATSAPDGSYEIRNVPRGRYRLHAWSEAPAGVARVVVVTGGEATPVDIDVPGDGGS
jgi:plastocyanin